MTTTTLISGSQSGIGKALVIEQLKIGPVISLSRHPEPPEQLRHDQLTHIQVDLTQGDSVAALKSELAGQVIQRVFACQGVLHSPQQQPEKSLQALSSDWLMHSIQTNVMCHVHLAQALAGNVSRRQPLRWLSLSAKVGSIEDNRLGGWYSYRMSKAALNMWIKNLAIEWGRKSPESIIAAIHPGTTDTDLSQPFQANLSDDKLYSSTLTAQRLSQVMANLTAQDHGKLLFWDGSHLPW
ncbi:SDR family oxidoreductase [Bacterioplanes sanyensis]|uniref:SDR family NAD(P)-dependent oxidoreductase n=1 Tax=Bacterioplanes sanyensis TaxID=1249553 RepID=UPI0016764EE6|nr:SDR family NAD(P)-dependent oxidoreductase [Bacterioplanes sanyensis]GGY32950.1 SDR family oxidoreductase [Bacterioplanes sanyensis]